MRSVFVNASFPALLCLAGSALAGPRPLPPLALSDASGAPVSLAALPRPSPWVILVVDADKHLTTAVLPRFQRKDGGWAGKLVVVAAGSPAAFERMVAQNAKLAGVRWTRDTSGRVLEQLGLSGTPVLLGVSPDNVITWQVAAVPEAPEKAQALAADWIAKAASEGGP
jgi:hypothetical protein